MASGKNDRKKEFQQNPFKGLKGFCVSPAEKAAVPERPVATAGSEAPARDEAAIFAEEMDRLGVVCRDVEEDATKAVAGRKEVDSPAVDTVPAANDQDLFLASLGSMEKVFVDDFPLAEDPAATPRRMRQVRRGELVPEAQLDLHGLGRDDARGRVRHFLENAVHHGRKTVLIVTGRGKSSGREPVLRAEIERYLRYEAAAWVAEWGRAPTRYGGEGALIIFLRGRKRSG